MSNVEKLTNVLNSLKLNSKNVKEDKDFTASVVNHIQAERKVLAKVLPSLMELVSDFECIDTFLKESDLIEMRSSFNLRPLKQERILRWTPLSLP